MACDLRKAFFSIIDSFPWPMGRALGSLRMILFETEGMGPMKRPGTVFFDKRCVFLQCVALLALLGSLKRKPGILEMLYLSFLLVFRGLWGEPLEASG